MNYARWSHREDGVLTSIGLLGMHIIAAKRSRLLQAFEFSKDQKRRIGIAGKAGELGLTGVVAWECGEAQEPPIDAFGLRALTPPQSVRKGCALLEAVVDNPDPESLIAWHPLSVAMTNPSGARYRPLPNHDDACHLRCSPEPNLSKNHTRSFVIPRKATNSEPQPYPLIQQHASSLASRWTWILIHMSGHQIREQDRFAKHLQLPRPLSHLSNISMR
ncbi:hypothetical protein QBC40DRAFT_346543 [Triangularia verruculosa]|uniref:Uncharacterized protein n=1 Tax=Triangularia verruculosa TaxID=2587418 RepID=A0AAN6XNW4_9PEZI|nr:hypothetical protein QBC40DRAFT_346543 [Triangularia verruculosa]